MARDAMHAKRQMAQNIKRGRGTRQPSESTTAPGKWQPPKRTPTGPLLPGRRVNKRHTTGGMG